MVCLLYVVFIFDTTYDNCIQRGASTLWGVYLADVATDSELS
jgi:hypothetical protein